MLRCWGRRRGGVVVLAAVLGLALLDDGRTPAAPVAVRSYLPRARQYLEQGNVPVAVALVRKAIAEDPGNGEAHLLLGHLLSRDGDTEGAVAAWVRASVLRPGWDAPRQALQSALREAVPRWLAADAMDRVPGDVVPVAVRRRAGADSLSADSACRVYSPPADAPGPAVADGKYGWQFPLHVYTFLRSGDMSRWDRRFGVHFQSREDTALAGRVAALLGQLALAAQDRLGPPAGGSSPEIHVWLCRTGTAGGEEWRGNLYLYQTGRPRSASEWVREVAHEYGHVAITGTRHYTDPEPKGNGYLGERLLPLWLADAGNERLWDGEANLTEYLRTRVAPAAAVFLNAGPAAEARRDRGRAGMDFTNGLILTLAWGHEPEFVDTLLRRQIGSTANNLLAAYRDRIRALKPLAFTLRGRTFVPARSDGATTGAGATGRRLAYRVFLPAGEWTLRLEGEAVTGARLRMDGQSLAPVQSGTFRWASEAAGWRLLELTAAEAKLALQAIHFRADREPSRAGETGG